MLNGGRFKKKPKSFFSMHSLFIHLYYSSTLLTVCLVLIWLKCTFSVPAGHYGHQPYWHPGLGPAQTRQDRQEDWVPPSEWRGRYHVQYFHIIARVAGVFSMFLILHRQARLDILKIHSRKMNLTRGINLRKIAELMPGASGAEVKVRVGTLNGCSLVWKTREYTI